MHAHINYIRYGFTSVLISDQGREFVNKVNKEFMSLAGEKWFISSFVIW